MSLMKSETIFHIAILNEDCPDNSNGICYNPSSKIHGKKCRRKGCPYAYAEMEKGVEKYEM